ncbi:MAG: ribonuclease Z [Saprospiraceae bacterium]|nr:ribonuclease Z [Saprospiraceae bacterium]
MKFELTILGSNSASPAFGRHLSSQVLNIGQNFFLIDCGDGTQNRMMNFKVKATKINQIFISHLHGDHFFGLVGLLMSYGLNNRKEPLHIYSPPGLKPIVEIQFNHELGYPIFFHETNPEKHVLLFENTSVKVFSIPLVHRVPCHGFLFVEKRRPPNMIKEKILEYQIPFNKIKDIKKGANFITKDQRVILHKELTKPASEPRSFAYCSDTEFSKEIIPFISGVDLLYHEATFMHDLLEMASKTKHTTAKQAAIIAKEAAVKKLVLGHFSSRYSDLTPLLSEARTVFENTILATEGIPIVI